MKRYKTSVKSGKRMMLHIPAPGVIAAMIARLSACLAACLALGLIASAQTDDDDQPDFDTIAEYACILDAETGLVLYGKNADAPMIPASMTKIMTAFMVFEAIESGRLSLRRKLTVSRNAWERGGHSSGGSSSFLAIGSRVSVQDLLRGLIVQSGNDAAIVLAEGIADSEEAFARQMTARAHELELYSASFTSAAGLYDDRHRISATDLAKLTAILISRFPQYYLIFSEKEFTYNGIKQSNRNPLLGDVPGADGVKTGHLNISGYGIVGSATRGGVRRIIVLNGLKSRDERDSESRRIMQEALKSFKVRRVVEQGIVVGKADVWLGETISVPLVALQTGIIGMHVSAIRKMRAQIVYDAPLIAPIRAGDPIGELQLKAPGVALLRLPVAAGADVPRLSLLQRAILGIAGAR